MLSSFVCRKRTITTNLSRQELAQALHERDTLVWVDLEDPNEFESESLVELFNFHPLAIEDCLNELSEPKLDDYEEYLFLVVHAIDPSAEEELKTIELDIFVSRNFVVTFHTKPIQSITLVRDWMERKFDSFTPDGTDTIVHAILDRLVDNYFPLVGGYERRIDEIENRLFEDGKNLLQRMLKLQKDILYLKRIIAPQREVMNQLARNARSFVRPKNMIYFRDIDDHLFRFYQMAEELIGLLNGVLQIYFSNASAKLNEVIKALTVIATLALPPMVIASIYGMNFRHMPELDWEWGYYFAWGLMTLSSAVILVFAKWKKWF
jgi:magnesium transporter